MEFKYYSHFIRGYFDGKGYWLFYPERQVCTFSIRSHSFEMIKKIQKILIDSCGLNNTRIIKRKLCYHVQYTGKKQCYNIYKYLYDNADVFLLRKYQIISVAFGGKELGKI